MTSIQIDRIDGLSSSVAIKGPCRVATTANITLSGGQTIDGVSVVTDDRVLVKNQTSTSENGIYVVDTGAWRRAKDFSRSNDIVVGTQIFVTSGTLYSQSGWLVSTFTSVGAAAIVFTQNVLVNGAALAALEASAQAASDAAELAQAEAEAAQASAELAASNIIPIGVVFGYSTTTADADPGAGLFRFNNATIASVTAAYIDNADNAANSVTAWLDTFDDSTNAVKGTLMIRGVTTAAAWAVFDVTGSVVDGTGYRKLTLTHKGSGGVWTNAHVFSMDFCRAGDAGAGTGDVVGPASAVTAHVASFNGTTGKLIQDSGLLVTDIVTLTGSPTLSTIEGLSLVAGDTLYATAADTITRLAKGTASQVLTMNAGATAPEWQTVATGRAPDAVLEDQKAANTAGGTATSGSWETRVLNTEVCDPAGLVSLSSNQFTVTANGWVEWSAPGWAVNNHKTRLYNVTDSVVVAEGESGFGQAAAFGLSRSGGGGAVVAGKTYRIENRVQNTNADDGMGAANNFGGAEVYTRVRFWRS